MEIARLVFVFKMAHYCGASDVSIRQGDVPPLDLFSQFFYSIPLLITASRIRFNRKY